MGWTVGAVLIVAVVLLVSWLGGGKKWAFRSLLSLLLLAVVIACGFVSYIAWSERVAEGQRQRIHECAVAKIATATCDSGPWNKYKASSDKNPFDEMCPPYMLPDDPTREQESTVMAAAEKACWAEALPTGTSLKQEVTAYRRQHGIKASEKTDDVAKKTKTCAAKVRKAFPHVYDDLDDETLTKKVLTKYPTYCD